MIIVVEGPDGVEKSTIATKICQAMMGNGVPYIKTHFPNHHIAPLDKDGTCWTVKLSVKQFLDGEVNIRYNPDAPVEGIIENIKLRGNEPDTFESDNQFLADVCVAGRYHALYGNWASYEVMDRLGHFDPDIPDTICRDLGYYPDEERL